MTKPTKTLDEIAAERGYVFKTINTGTGRTCKDYVFTRDDVKFVFDRRGRFTEAVAYVAELRLTGVAVEFSAPREVRYGTREVFAEWLLSLTREMLLDKAEALLVAARQQHEVALRDIEAQVEAVQALRAKSPRDACLA